MALYHFKEQFVPSIEDGTKHGTIRKPRKVPTKIGDTIYMYTGSRYNPRKIGTALCRSTHRITITSKSISVHITKREVSKLESIDALNVFARGDGFSDWRDMKQFWMDTHGKLPFTGEWVRWYNFKKTNPL